MACRVRDRQNQGLLDPRGDVLDDVAGKCARLPRCSDKYRRRDRSYDGAEISLAFLETDCSGQFCGPGELSFVFVTDTAVIDDQTAAIQYRDMATYLVRRQSFICEGTPDLPRYPETGGSGTENEDGLVPELSTAEPPGRHHGCQRYGAGPLDIVIE